MYVLVLGLDVLGNPFGLISGLAGGAKDFFYEPYQVRQCDSLSRYPEYLRDSVIEICVTLTI